MPSTGDGPKRRWYCKKSTCLCLSKWVKHEWWFRELQCVFSQIILRREEWSPKSVCSLRFISITCFGCHGCSSQLSFQRRNKQILWGLLFILSFKNVNFHPVFLQSPFKWRECSTLFLELSGKWSLNWKEMIRNVHSFVNEFPVISFQAGPWVSLKRISSHHTHTHTFLWPLETWQKGGWGLS